MHLFALSALTMIAFAANSVLNRMALLDGGIDPATFGAVRLFSGAAVLWLLVALGRGALRGAGDWRAALALFVYIFGFSYAYVELDAGLGALLLFGMVQITMFAGGLAGGERPPLLRWLGTGVAFAGLVWLLWPGGAISVGFWPAVFMIGAGVGWGFYSLLGRGAANPLAATAANFAMAAPFGIGWALVFAADQMADSSLRGIMLACWSGAVTSGLGYALWYRVLPSLAPSVAAVAQLCVPVIAMVGGLVLLGEVITLSLVIGTALVMAGIILALQARG